MHIYRLEYLSILKCLWFDFQLKSRLFLLMFPSQRGKIDSLPDGEDVKIDCPPL